MVSSGAFSFSAKGFRVSSDSVCAMKTTDYPVITIKPDINGNSRRVIHWYAFITHEDRVDRAGVGRSTSTSMYEWALRKARKLGGRKFHNKQYGGGIVFQASSDEEVYALVERAINKA
jgi:hypothetical protein